MINVGDYVEFGRWAQNLNGTVNDVEWRVLAIEEGTALLVSRFGLAAKRFDGSSNEWEDSELRQWLNGEFKSRAFSPEEQGSLKGEIAVPSWQEAKKLIPNTGVVRKCSPTPWAKANGAATYDLRRPMFLVDEKQSGRLLAGRLRCRFRRRLLYETLPSGDLLRQAAHPCKRGGSEG